MNEQESWIKRILRPWRQGPAELAAVSARVEDGPGWVNNSAAPHERDLAEVQQLYQDALTAWRVNPLARRVIDLTTDFVVGDGIWLEASGQIGRFLQRWWQHPQNNFDLTLPDLVDELGRAGDLFVTLHRNPADGMSYLRPVPKDRIVQIETAPKDWACELAYLESDAGGMQRRWLAPRHPEAADAPAVMLHYAVNRPVGALLGESDLAPVLPWLRRYSRLLEDRVRLNRAVRAFLWMVTVPTNRVQDKANQYRLPPEPGSVIVKDEAERWEPVAPLLRGNDASYDLKAVRRMVQAGSFPPHWLNDPEDINRATAAAMSNPATRQLRRRQLAVRHMLVDLAHTAYSRAYELGMQRTRPDRAAIQVKLPEISRDDNATLAAAARNLAQAMAAMKGQLDAKRPAYSRLLLEWVSQFAGEPLPAAQVNAILEELENEHEQE